MAIDRLRLYLAVKETLAWHGLVGQIVRAPRHTVERLAQEYERREPLVWAELQAALDGYERPLPINMVLHCPRCHLQHIDAPDSEPSAYADGRESQWTNPPHRSHLCHGCGFIWRPADVPTNGVQAVRTRGKNDT